MGPLGAFCSLCVFADKPGQCMNFECDFYNLCCHMVWGIGHLLCSE